MGKRKKILIECPVCRAHLFVKRSLFKVTSHPVYAKKGKLIINYSKSIYTEQRQSKLWLRCLNCSFSQVCKDENELKEVIMQKIGGLGNLFPQKHHRPREEKLPTIIRPSKIGYGTQ